MNIRSLFAWSVYAVAAASVDQALAQSGMVDCRVLPSPNEDCISPADRAFAEGLIADYVAEHGPLSSGHSRSAPPLLTFFPIAGNLYHDIWLGNFVDMDPNAGGYDFQCTTYADDGHLGHDAGVPWFDTQILGVPVFAALDGTVIATNDGEDDMNLSGSATPGNFVFLDHGSGLITSYWHLKKNSVSVSVGQAVSAGDPIGMVASSGNSFGPHLHFELELNGSIYEPFTGACNPGPSGWENQPAIDTSSYAWDFGVWHEDLLTYPWWPTKFPAEGQIAVTDEYMEFWLLGNNLPNATDWRVQFRRPDGVITFDSGTWPWGNTELYEWYLTWWRYYLADIPDMQATTGTWHILIDIGGERIVDAPIEIRAARTTGFNRPPEAITVSFDPAAPQDDDVILCRVSTSPVTDDLDYDTVRYHYVWRVNGGIVRDVTHAGQADAIPHDMIATCDQVECEVTPEDAAASGPTASVSVFIAAACPGDLDNNGTVDLTDLGVLLGNYGSANPTAADGDLNCDGEIDLTDLGSLLGAYGDGC